MVYLKGMEMASITHHLPVQMDSSYLVAISYLSTKVNGYESFILNWVMIFEAKESQNSVLSLL